MWPMAAWSAGSWGPSHEASLPRIMQDLLEPLRPGCLCAELVEPLRPGCSCAELVYEAECWGILYNHRIKCSSFSWAG